MEDTAGGVADAATVAGSAPFEGNACGELVATAVADTETVTVVTPPDSPDEATSVVAFVTMKEPILQLRDLRWSARHAARVRQITHTQAQHHSTKDHFARY
jgi:hypothetical protein